MPIDTNFPTAEEEFEALKPRLPSPPLTIEYPDSLKDSFGESDFQPLETPYNVTKEPAKESAGFFSSAAHEFKEINSVAHGLDYLYNKYNTDNQPQISNQLEHQNPLDDTAPKGWTPFHEENLHDIDQRFWPYITDAQSPNDLQARRNEAMRIQKDDEYYKDGSTIGKILGGVVGAVTDPWAWVPIAGTLKYAKTGANIIKNIARQAPGLAVSTIGYTATIDATTTGKTMGDFAYDASVNMVAGIFISGAAAGLSKKITGGVLYEARNALNLNRQGIEIVPKIDDKGVIRDYIARPAPGNSVSAQEVTRAQEFLDSKFAKRGLFALPYVGTGAEKVSGVFSPIVRGLSSSWKTTNAFTNRIADHSIETMGVSAERAKPQNAEFLLRTFHSQGILMGQTIEGYRNLANGMGGEGIVDATKRITKRMTQGTQYSKDDWGRMVMTHLFTGEASDVAEVNQLGNELKEYYARTLNLYQKAHGLEERDLPVKTATEYLSRRYDVDYMLANNQQWNDMVVEWFKDGDKTISTLMEPVNQAKAHLDSIKQFIHNGVNVDENRALLKDATRNYKEVRQELKQTIRDNPEHHIHLEENITMSAQEENSLREKLKPYNQAKKQLKTKASELGGAKKELSSLKKKYESGSKNKRAPKDYDSLKTNIVELEERINTLESQHAELIDARDVERFKLLDEVSEGTITRNMIRKHPESGAISFRNPNEMPKFRPLYSSNEYPESKMLEASQAYFEQITGNNPDKLALQMLNGLHGSATGNPMKERSLMIPDQVLLENNFLSTDIARNAMLYNLTLGKSTAFQSAFKGFGVSKDGIHGILDELNKERKGRIASLGDMPKDKATKALLKIQKDFNKEKKFIEKMYGVFHGNNDDSQETRDLVKAIRSLTAATRLGNVPIAQLPDLAGNIFKNGPWRFFRDGLTPALKTINGQIKSKSGDSYKKNASEALLCLEGVINSHSDSLWNFSTQSTATIPGKIAGWTDTMARVSGNLSGTNMIENFNQAMSANIAQSRIIDSMFRYKAGTLSKKDSRRLAQLGIDPALWSERITNSFTQHGGEQGVAGGYQSNYFDWADKGARNIMGDTIRKTVRDTVIQRGTFDSPLMSNNPVTSLFFTFTGWAFAAFNRYTVPMLQRPLDSNVFTGSIALIGLGALVDPLRKWSRGEEFKLDDDQWFGHAVSNTAPFAPIYNIAMKMNALSGNRFLSDMKNDKRRNISLAGELGGAPMGLAQIYWNTLKMIGSGKYNKTDAKAAFNAVPMIQMWYLNNFKNQFMDSLTQGLPNTYT